MRTGISDRQQPHRFAAVGPGELRRQPDQVANVRRRFDFDALDALVRHPVVSPVQQHLGDRSEPRIRIREPLERLAVEATAGRQRRLESFAAQRRRLCGLALRIQRERLQQGRNPGQRLTEDQRRAQSFEDVAADAFALNGGRVGVFHRQCAGVQLAGHVELVEGAIPIARHHQQLRQEYAQLAVGGLTTDIVLQFRQATGEVTRPKQLVGCTHSLT